MSATTLDKFSALGRRFVGVDLQFRRSTNSRNVNDRSSEWPHPWRARLVAHRNERAEYQQLTVFGASAIEAMANLVAQVERVDAVARAVVVG